VTIVYESEMNSLSLVGIKVIYKLGIAIVIII